MKSILCEIHILHLPTYQPKQLKLIKAKKKDQCNRIYWAKCININNKTYKLTNFQTQTTKQIYQTQSTKTKKCNEIHELIECNQTHETQTRSLGNCMDIEKKNL